MKNILASALLGFCVFQSAGAQVPPEVSDALEGLDPVALVAGREVPGRMAHTAVHDGFRYMFESADHLAAFKKSPESYAVQYRGMCARMGAPAAGNHGLYAVHEGRIYLFASSGCMTAFKAEPSKFIAPAIAAPKVTPSESAAARQLLARAAGGFGGADRVDSVVALRTVAKQPLPARAGGAAGTMTTTTTAAWPDQLRQDFAQGGMSMLMVVTPVDAFRAMGPDLRPLHQAQSEALRTEALRHPLWIVKGRADSGLQAWPEGQGKVGDIVTADIGVSVRGERIRLSLDPASNRVLRMSFPGRGPDGAFGEVAITYSDFRDAGSGVTVAFSEAMTFNGTPTERTPLIERVEVNPAVDASFFARPVRR